MIDDHILAKKLFLKKAWSDEARAAAAEARRGGGSKDQKFPKQDPKEPYDEKGYRDLDPNNDDELAAGRFGTHPADEQDLSQAHAEIMQNLKNGGSWQAGPDDSSWHVAQEKMSGEMGGDIPKGALYEHDWNDTGDKVAQSPADFKEALKQHMTWFRRPDGRLNVAGLIRGEGG